MLRSKIKLALFTLERWFAWIFFFASFGLGAYLAGGNFGELKVWMGVIMVTGLMCYGHCVNSILDYWVGLDSGEANDRSVEKNYSGGQSVLATKQCSITFISIVASVWAVIAVGCAYWFILNGQPIMMAMWALGMMVPWAYTPAKFTTWAHELVLGIGVGPLATMSGMFAISNHPPVIAGLLVSIIPMVVLSFAGLSLDEFPDASANLKKGVKSLAYKVWEHSDDLKIWDGEATFWARTKIVKSYSLLRWYLTSWLLMLFGFQVFLIQLGILKPLTGLGFIMFPPILCSLVFLKNQFNKTAAIIVILAAVYLILILVGQIVGG